MQGIRVFFVTLYQHVLQGAYPTLRAAQVYFGWFFLQALLQHFVPGKEVLGIVTLLHTHHHMFSSHHMHFNYEFENKQQKGVP